MAWMGDAPKKCDLCPNPLTEVFYDGAVIGHGWAIMCHRCFVLFGVGLGIGKGQKYDVRTGKKLDG